VRIRYGRWSGTQDPFPAEVSPDDVLSEISEDVLGGLSPDEALERLLHRGMAGRAGRIPGLAELRRRVAEARRRELERMGLEGPLRQVEQRLSEIVDIERTALDLAGDDEMAAAHHQELDALPPDPAGRIAALQRYDWHDQRAAADFAELLDSLRRDVAQATYGQLAGALGAMDAEGIARAKDMLAELNGMIERDRRGEDVSADFAAFRERYPEVVGDAQTLDELLEDLARRMAAMSRLLAGMSPEQRENLMRLAAEVFGDEELAFQTEMLRDALQAAHPELGWETPMPGAMPGGDDGSLSEAVDWMQRLQEHEDLGQALGQDYPGARLDDIDEEALRAVAGDEAVHDLRALREIERALEEAGAAGRTHGRLELTPRGIRRLGERSLAQIYGQAADGAIGSHDVRRAGGDGELTGATRPWRFGDPFRPDITHSIRNAILRQAESAGGRFEGRVRMAAEDFELAEAERRVRCATVLLLDMSFSMPLRGNWVPAKRVALALQSLIDGQFPEDRFYVVGFSDFARRLEPRDLVATGWEPVMGTNMQHAFLLARRLLGAHPDAQAQVIMVTDGEPTAHLEEGEAYFSWPPEPKTLRLALLEARRLARTGATLNVFLLDHDPGAARFVERMVQACKGRIFYPDLTDLGSVVVEDFLSGRSRRRAG
jgi:uncharacterized protein with von Willebrand factor type A (vWA) domain